LLLVYVSISANTPSTAGNLFSSSSLTLNTPTPTQIRITQDSNSQQYPVNSIQYASSPASEYASGGSVFTDGNGIHVHPQYTPSISEYPQAGAYQPGVYQPGTYQPGAYPSYGRSEVNLVRSADPYGHLQVFDSFGGRIPTNYGDYPTSTYSNSHFGNGRVGRVASQNVHSGSRYLPSHLAKLPSVSQPTKPSQVLPRGLGRVMPLNPHPYGRGIQGYPQNPDYASQGRGLGRVMLTPKEERTQEMVMFTLGRALGKLDSDGNQTNTAQFLEKLLGLTQPKNPWEQYFSSNPWEQEKSNPWGQYSSPWQQQQQQQQQQRGEQSTSLWEQWEQFEKSKSPVEGKWGKSSPAWQPQFQWGQQRTNSFSQPQFGQGQYTNQYTSFGGDPRYNRNQFDWRQPQQSYPWESNPWGFEDDNSWWWVDLLEEEKKKEEEKPWWYELLKDHKQQEDN